MEKFWFEDEVRAAAEAHGLDPKLVKAVCMVESSGRTNAYRYEPAFWLRYLAKNPAFQNQNPRRVSASYGLMQVMYPTAVQHGFKASPEMLFCPMVGLTSGCQHLKFLLDRCNGNVEQALAQYNGGAGGNEQPPYRNGPYAAKVLRWYEEFKA
jgi:soluble lytic murein transglycosylase-like protein